MHRSIHHTSTDLQLFSPPRCPTSCLHDSGLHPGYRFPLQHWCPWPSSWRICQSLASLRLRRCVIPFQPLFLCSFLVNICSYIGINRKPFISPRLERVQRIVGRSLWSSSFSRHIIIIEVEAMERYWWSSGGLFFPDIEIIVFLWVGFVADRYVLQKSGWRFCDKVLEHSCLSAIRFLGLVSHTLMRLVPYIKKKNVCLFEDSQLFDAFMTSSVSKHVENGFGLMSRSSKRRVFLLTPCLMFRLHLIQWCMCSVGLKKVPLLYPLMKVKMEF